MALEIAGATEKSILIKIGRLMGAKREESSKEMCHASNIKFHGVLSMNEAVINFRDQKCLHIHTHKQTSHENNRLRTTSNCRHGELSHAQDKVIPDVVYVQ